MLPGLFHLNNPFLYIMFRNRILDGTFRLFANVYQDSLMSYRPFGADSAFRPFHDYIDRTQYGGVATSTTKVKKKNSFNILSQKIHSTDFQPPRDYEGGFGQGLGQASYDQLELLY